MLEHIFNKYPISLSGVLDKNVGHGSYDCAILDNRRTAHALDDATGKV